MIGRALHCEIERDFHLVLGAGRDQPAEVGERAELGVDRVMAALFVADGVEAAGIAGLGMKRVVRALAVGMADRMDRREIKHVEAKRGDLRQPRDAVVEGAVFAGHFALAARHHLVPGADARALPVGGERNDGTAREVGALVGFFHCRRQRVVKQNGGFFAEANLRAAASTTRRASRALGINSVKSSWPSRASNEIS